MNKESVISEIRKDYEKSRSGILLLSLSCALMCLGLLGIAIYPEYTGIGVAVFAVGAALLFLSVFTDRHSAKKADTLYVENFVIPEIAKHLNGVKSEKFAFNREYISKTGFFNNLQWTDVDGRRTFSGYLRDCEITFCDLGVYNLLNVSKGKHAKSDTEKDYVFRGRFFDIKTDLDEKTAAEIITKAERYDLCGEGSVRAEYKPGHLYILHNVAAGDILSKDWLSFPFEDKATEEPEISEAVKQDIEPYMTMIKYLF